MPDLLGPRPPRRHPRRPSPLRSPSLRTSTGRATAGLVALALLLAGCGGGQDESASDDAGVVTSMPAPAAPEMAFEDVDRSGGGSDVVGDRPADDRAIVRNATIELVVDDGAAAFAAVTDAATAADGSVASAAQSRGEDGSISGDLVLRS